MHTRDEIIDRVIGIEGGYVDDPRDSGGRTRWGITETTARRHGYYGAMREMPVDVARQIYISGYWRPLRCDELVAMELPRMAEELFEGAVNCGPSTSARWLQRALNVLNRRGSLYPDLRIDGSIGQRTLRAVELLAAAEGREAADELLEHVLNTCQGAHYLDLCERREKDEAFIRGWLTRTAARRGP